MYKSWPLQCTYNEYLLIGLFLVHQTNYKRYLRAQVRVLVTCAWLTTPIYLNVVCVCAECIIYLGLTNLYKKYVSHRLFDSVSFSYKSGGGIAPSASMVLMAVLIEHQCT